LSEALSPLRGEPSKRGAVKKLARCQEPRASRLTTRSLGGSSATTLTARGFEFGSSMRKRASSVVVMRAHSLDIGTLLGLDTRPAGRAGAFWVDNISATQASKDAQSEQGARTMPNRIDLCSAADVAPGAALKVETGALALAVFNVDGEYFVTDDLCTHGP